MSLLARVGAPIVAVVLSLAGAAPALGQGTTGILPDDLHVADAERIAQRLALSREQHRAWLDMHRGYAERMAGVHATSGAWIVEHLEDLHTGQSDQAALETFFRRRDGAMTRMSALEDALFAELIVTVEPARMPRVERQRLRRARERSIRSTLTWFIAAAKVDLIDWALDAELDRETQARIEPLLAAYEGRLTSLTATVLTRAIEMQLKFADEVAALGITPAMEADPARANEVMAARKEAAAILSARAFRSDHDIRVLSRRTYELLLGQLPGGDARALRRWFLPRAYPELWAIVGEIEERLGDLLADEARAADRKDLLALRDTYDARRTDFERTALLYLDEFHAEHNMLNMTGEAFAAHQAQLAELRGRHDGIVADVEGSSGLLARADDPAPSPTPAAAQASADPWAGLLLATPLDEERLLSAFDDDGRVHATAALQAHGRVVAATLERVSTREAALDGGTADGVAARRELYALANEELRGHDDDLFDALLALAATAGRPRLEEARRDRDHERYAPILERTTEGLPGFTLFLALHDAGVPATGDWRRRLGPYATDLVDLLETLHAAQLRRTELIARIAVDRGDGSVFTHLVETDERIRRTSAALLALNRDTFGEWTTFPQTVTAAFDARALPIAWGAPDPLADAFEERLATDGLRPDDREDVLRVRDGYRADLGSARAAIAPVERRLQEAIAAETPEMAERQRLQARLQRLLHERDELGARARAELGLIGPAQDR
jgi:hypothetical protein